MHWLTRLRVAFLFLTLEIGALFGVPIPPEKVREIMDLMHRPKTTQVMRDEASDVKPD